MVYTFSISSIYWPLFVKERKQNVVNLPISTHNSPLRPEIWLLAWARYLWLSNNGTKFSAILHVKLGIALCDNMPKISEATHLRGSRHRLPLWWYVICEFRTGMPVSGSQRKPQISQPFLISLGAEDSGLGSQYTHLYSWIVYKCQGRPFCDMTGVMPSWWQLTGVFTNENSDTCSSRSIKYFAGAIIDADCVGKFATRHIIPIR